MPTMDRYADTVLTRTLPDGATLEGAIDEIRAYLTRLAEFNRLRALHEPLLDAMENREAVAAAEAAWAYVRDTSDGSPFQRSNGVMWVHLTLARFFDPTFVPAAA